MAAPGAAIGAPVIQTQSLIPLVERVGNQLDLRKRQDRQRQDKINSEWLDYMSDLNRNGLDTVQNSTITQKHQKVMGSYAADLKSGGGQMDYSKRLEHLQAQTQLQASADRMRAANENVKNLGIEVDGKGYYKDQQIKRDAYNALHQFDEATGQWVARDDVVPDEINKMLSDAKYIDGDAYFKKDLEDFEKITMIGERQGPLGSTMITDIETRDVWQRDDDGTITRGANGEPVPNLPIIMEELVKDPDKRKIYQSLAAEAGQSLGEYMHDKVMANTGYSERYRTNIRPFKPTTDRTAATAKLQDSRNRVVLNKLQGMFNQSDEVFATATESDEETPSGGLYDDVTDQFPWAIAKERRPHQVFLDKERPGKIFIRQNEGDELQSITQDQLPDYIQRIETFNPNNKGITDLGMREEFFDVEGTVKTTAGPQADPEQALARQQEARALQEHRKQLKSKYRDVDQQLRGPKTFLERFRSLSEADAKTLQDQLNADFGNARLSLTQEEAEDFEMPSRTVRNLRFEVVPGQRQRVKMFSGDTQIGGDMTPEEFKAFFDLGKLVVGVDALPKAEEPSPNPLPETADDIGLPEK